MNILQVHNRYKITGGEWTVVNQELDLLQKNHTVHQLIAENNKELGSLLSLIKLIFNTHYNRRSKERVRKKIRETGSEIMHVHNFFPLLSPSIFESAREEGIPSVLTLHNFRLIHPNGTLYHHGTIDERSIHRSAYACVLDGVYRDSILQTAVVAHMIEFHRKKQTWSKDVDCMLCLTDFAREKFIEAGLPKDKLIVKPNFIADPFSDRSFLNSENKKSDTYLFIGRISEEKGIRTLIEAWNSLKNDHLFKLRIVGEGPLKRELQKQTEQNPCITWTGFIDREEVLDLLKQARALIFPSEWFEGMPMTILEAFAAGTPVLSTNIGSQAEIVDNGITGLHFEPGNVESLLAVLEKFENFKEKDEMGIAARAEYEKKYTPEINRKKLEKIYQNLVK